MSDLRDLEPLFNMSWNGWPMFFEVRDTTGLIVDIYECRRCGALVRRPHMHFDWHGKVDTNATVQT